MLNRIILMGRLVDNPELRQTPSGVSVASFTVAVDRNFQPKDASERQTDFINCVAWRQTAEFITKYFQKGSMIAVNGTLQQRSYTDKDGNKRTAYDVVIDNASFCGSKSEGSTRPRSDEPASFSNAGMGDFEEITMSDDDLPF